MKRLWVWVLIGILIGGGTALGAIYFIGEDGLIQPEAQARDEDETNGSAAEEASPEERERRAIELALNFKEADLEQALLTPEGWVLGIEMKADDPEIVTVLSDARQTFQEVDHLQVPVAEIAISVRTDEFKDIYGNQLQDVVITRIGLSGETFAKIDWDGFESENFPTVAEEFWVHQVLVDQAGEQAAGSEGDEQNNGGGNGGGS